jgi:tetratricopeptide (TPR) repeat protein
MVQDVSAPTPSAAPKPETTEAVPEPEPSPEPEAPAAPEPASQEASAPTFEFDEEAAKQPAAAEDSEFELELAPASSPAKNKAEPATTEDFLSELAAEIEDMETPAAGKAASPPAPKATAPAEPVLEATSANLNELSQVFQEFRSELGEMSEDEDEDLETHYNLGIAYREMGLLDEAIGEFQKVSQAIQKGKPFPYAMNCSTLLALSFMDKGEPKIAAMWYEKALDMPGLDQESVLALRYDLGIALDAAGEADAALESFRQVYAMNIDYRDVADRIATLQKH